MCMCVCGGERIERQTMVTEDSLRVRERERERGRRGGETE